MGRKTIGSITLPLFDSVEPPPLSKEMGEGSEQEASYVNTNLEWSYSKRSVLEQCPRKFYYQYYGANTRKAKEEPEKERLRKLKATGNRYTRTGYILHVVVAHYLRTAQQGIPLERKAWLDWARKLFQRDVTRSRAGLDAEILSVYQHPPQFLVEFLYEEDARSLCREAEAEMIAALETFLDSPQIAAVRELGMQDGTLIEKHFYRLAGIPFRVEGQVDLVHCFDHDRVTIVDWKSGDELGEGDDSLQLAVYALWAQETFACDTEAIALYKAFLGSGDLVAFPLTDALLNAARLKILQDAQGFSRMDAYGRDGVTRAFTPCAQEAVCRGCSFATICPEGKEILT